MDTLRSATKGGQERGRSLLLSGYARYVFWILLAISFLNYLDRYVLTGAAQTVADDLHFDLVDFGAITSAFIIVYTLGTVPLGLLADRIQRKGVVAACVAIWSVATALTALATNYASLFLSRMVLGIGEAGYFPAGTALLSDYTSRAKRSRVMSMWSIGQFVGILGGYAIGGIVTKGNWRLAFLFTGIPGLALALLAWRLREPRRNQADEEEDVQKITLDGIVQQEFPPAIGPTLGTSSTPIVTPTRTQQRNIFTESISALVQSMSLLRIKTLCILIAMQIFAFFVLGVSTTFLPIYMQQVDTYGMSSSSAGIYAGGVIVLSGIAGTMIGGYMADWLGRRHNGSRVLVCGIGFLLCAPCFACAILLHNRILFTIFFALTAILITVYTGPSTAATQDVVPARFRSSAVAISLLIAHLLGDAFAPLLVGVLATAFDPTHGQHIHIKMAGLELGQALLITCTPALLIAGLIGIFGARFMSADVADAIKADQQDRLTAV